MINFEKIWEKYFVFSDNDIWKYWPFDSLWIKWVFEWKEFICDRKNLKSWRNAIWIFKWKIYLFEEEKSKLNFIIQNNL